MSPIATKESVESMLIPNLAQFVSKLFIDAHERSRILDHFVESNGWQPITSFYTPSDEAFCDPRLTCRLAVKALSEGWKVEQDSLCLHQ